MNEAISADDRNWAMYANLAGLLLLANIPFVNVIGPLLVYLKARKEPSAFVIEHARASLNFQITFTLIVTILLVAALGAWGATIGLAIAVSGNQDAGPVLAFVVWLFMIVALLLLATTGNVVCCIVGAIAASNGRRFRYPLAIPFVR